MSDGVERVDERPSSDIAIVLVSGGLDSATALAVARRDGHRCYALSFDYGQRHAAELQAAARVAAEAGVVAHRTMAVHELGRLGGSALTDPTLAIPEGPGRDIPVTYVPARNTVFLSLALAWAEVLGAAHIYIGVNALDYSGYPDCRPEYIAAFQRLADLATKSAVSGRPVRIHAPLIDMGKAEIITLGTRLGVDFALTVSCYAADEGGRACGRCDACRLRAEGFAKAALADPTRYLP